MSRTLFETLLNRRRVDGASAPTSQNRRKNSSFLRLGLILSCVVVGITLIAWLIVGGEIAEERANNDGNAQLLTQRATDSLADKTRTLFASLESLVRLSSLMLQVTQCCDATAQHAVEQTMLEAIQKNPLSIQALELQAPSGASVISLGDEPQGIPIEATLQSGPGLPSLVRGGRHVAHMMLQLPNNAGYSLRVTFDLDTLASALRSNLPPHMQVVLYRLSDGATLISLAEVGHQPKLEHADKIRFLDTKTLEALNVNDHGWISDSANESNPQAQKLAFSSLHELGIVIVNRAINVDTDADYDTIGQIVGFAPVVIFIVGSIFAAGILIVISRRRIRLEQETEHRASVAEAAARLELQQLVSCSPAMLYRGRLMPNGEFVRDLLSPNTREVTGWESYVLADPEQIWNLTAEEDRGLRAKNYIRAAAEGRAAVEYRFQRPDGAYSWLRNEAMVIRRLPDGATELAGAITNISREREISAYAAMQNRLASLGETSASLAHELTQPMTVIGIASALAQNAVRTGANPENLDRHLTSIVTQTERALDIIRHLRLYGRADGGPMADIHLRQAAQGALSLVGRTLREADVDISVEIGEGLPPVRARLVQVEQIIVNLLINARDAMSGNPPGARRVVIRGHVVNGLTRLQVEDTGPGVPASLVDRLFESFYTTKAPGEGTGLGLSLCQTMMRQFGGSISAANGRYGAIFSLDFPMVATKSAADVESADLH
jgi:C4-dicarboxylate-specific signal transduction histidine kinase